uniref:Uncharacterized protein n=1 Tax=Avena sativa TaxID=4498 RepID=A0ACD6AK10_AVESA
MGKYMRRKCGRGGAAGDSGKQAAPAVVLGPRTRSRAAVAVSESEANPAKRRKQADEASSDGRDAGDASAGCYLHLRSRRLFMPAASAVAEEEASAARRADSLAAPSGEAGAVGISRCSSTASSTVDVAARERSGGEAEARENADVESSVSDSSERGGRESLRRETTPSSSRLPIDCSDLESNQAQATDEQQKRKRRRSPATTTTTVTTTAFHLQSRLRMPAEEEIDEFFAAAEKAQAQRFAAKYNFDVALGLPLNAGRFEWTPVATV